MNSYYHIDAYVHKNAPLDIKTFTTNLQDQSLPNGTFGFIGLPNNTWAETHEHIIYIVKDNTFYAVAKLFATTHPLILIFHTPGMLYEQDNGSYLLKKPGFEMEYSSKHLFHIVSPENLESLLKKVQVMNND